MSREPNRILATFDDATVRVYQAFSPAIADAALAAQTLVAPFKRERMTWWKVSLPWMLHRSSFATARDQERVLAIDVTRAGFDDALARACLTAFEARIHGTIEAWKRSMIESPVRIQWDPDRTISMEPRERRTIQIGIGGNAVDAYLDEWIVRIEDITPLAHELAALVRDGSGERAGSRLPVEREYPLLETSATRIGSGW